MSEPSDAVYLAAVGDIVQIDPNGDPVFGGCCLVVTEVDTFDLRGYVMVPGQGPVNHRADWPNVVRIGRAQWTRD